MPGMPSQTRSQAIDVTLLRQIHGCREVHLAEMPDWFWKSVCRVTSGWSETAAVAGMIQLTDECPFPLFSNWGRSTGADGRAVFAVEPDVGSTPPEVVRQWADGIARRLGLGCSGRGKDESWSHPGQNVRIEFFACEPACDARPTPYTFPASPN